MEVEEEDPKVEMGIMPQLGLCKGSRSMGVGGDWYQRLRI